MIKQVFKTMVAFLAVATMAIGPVRGQNAMAVWPLTAYGDLQTGDTVVILDKTSAKALPSSASSTTPSTVLVTLNSAKDTLISPAANLLWVVTKNGNTYQFNQPGSSNYLYFIDYSNGVRVGNNSDNQFTFQNGGAYNVPFLKHNATSSYLGLNDAGEWRCAGSISNTSTIKNTVISFYKKTVIIIPTYTVRMAAGTEDAEHWSLASGNASVPGTQVLENVMSGSQVTATYSGTQKVKSVKAVKYVAPPTPLDNTTTAWTAGTFAVPEGGLTYSDAITVSGDVTLTLTDGTTLTLNKGISLAEGATLTIQGNGTMNVNGTNESTASTVAGTGTLVLTSGTLTARGGNGGSVGDFNDHSHGGNGGNAINGSVIVSGGTLTARGGNGGSVGEASDDCSGGNGGDAISGTLTINGGSTSVNNGSNGSIGEDCEDCTAGTGGKAVAGTVTDNR